jgi:hypothetical protein
LSWCSLMRQVTRYVDTKLFRSLLKLGKFCNELLKKNGPGGTEAAVLLRNTLSERIATRFPEITRNKYSLVIRILASLKILSLNVAASGKTATHLPFFTEFEKVGPYFDLVVTTDDKGVKDKICGEFNYWSE